ncbi:MAG: hypothetical protein U1A27_11970 [Phycisphaerae bacterium]
MSAGAAHPRGTLRRRARCAGCCGVIAAAWLAAAARGDEPVSTSQPAPAEIGPAGGAAPNFFSLDRLDAAVEMGAEYEQRRVRTDEPYYFGRPTRQTNRRQTFGEQLLFDLAGSTPNPNVLSLAGNVGLGGTQERYRERYNSHTDVDSNDGFLSSYDLHADLLRDQKLSGTAYGLRTRDRYTRAFLPSLREERSEYGTAWYWSDETLPMQLSYDHRNVDRTGSRRRNDDENLEQDVLRYQATWITSRQHSLRLQYEHEESEERYAGSWPAMIYENRRDQWRADDEILFGEQLQHRLDTVVRVQDERGDYARDLIELGPRLSLRHSDVLSTHYQYQFTREEVGQLQLDTHRADWQVVHQPMQDVTATYDFFGLSERDAEESETRELGATGDWSFARDNRLGRFSADLSLTAESERTNGDGLRAVVAESGAFLDPLPITLSRPGVIPWTVVVRDPTRLRIYVPGFDYLVQRFGDRTVLFRNPIGLIPIGATVSIDYLARVPRGGQARDTQLANFGVEQQFRNGLTPYYRFDFRNDDRNVPHRSLRYDDYQQNRHRLGLRFRRDRVTAGAELEVMQDEIDPFTAGRFYATHALLRQPARTIDLRADLSQYHFDRADRGTATVVELGFDGRAALESRLDAFLTGTYRYEHDGTRGRGVINGVDVDAGLTYKWGQFTLTASIEYDLLDIVQSREDGLGVWIRVRRDLPALLGKSR